MFECELIFVVESNLYYQGKEEIDFEGEKIVIVKRYKRGDVVKGRFFLFFGFFRVWIVGEYLEELFFEFLFK